MLAFVCRSLQNQTFNGSFLGFLTSTQPTKLHSLCFKYSSDLSSLVSTYVLLLTDIIIDFCKNCKRDRLAIIENSSYFWEPLIESEYKLVGTRYITQQELGQSYIRV
jgi:hypothetical protein